MIGLAQHPRDQKFFWFVSWIKAFLTRCLQTQERLKTMRFKFSTAPADMVRCIAATAQRHISALVTVHGYRIGKKPQFNSHVFMADELSTCRLVSHPQRIDVTRPRYEHRRGFLGFQQEVVPF